MSTFFLINKRLADFTHYSFEADRKHPGVGPIAILLPPFCTGRVRRHAVRQIGRIAIPIEPALQTQKHLSQKHSWKPQKVLLYSHKVRTFTPVQVEGYIAAAVVTGTHRHLEVVGRLICVVPVQAIARIRVPPNRLRPRPPSQAKQPLRLPLR